MRKLRQKYKINHECMLYVGLNKVRFTTNDFCLHNTDRQPGVLNDRRRKPSSLRREANDGRQRKLARRLENKLANVAKSQCLDAWYQSLNSSLFFLAAWPQSGRSTIELEGTAWRLGMYFFVIGERVL